MEYFRRPGIVEGIATTVKTAFKRKPPIKRQSGKPTKAQREKKLWEEKGFYPLRERIPLNESSFPEAARRVNQTLQLMKESNNPYFKSAAELILSLRDDKKELILTYYHQPEGQKQKNSYPMGTRLYLNENGNVRYNISIDMNEVLHEVEAPVLAMELAHEAEHLRNLQKIVESQSKTHTPQQIIDNENRRASTPREIVAEEARGYAITSQAYVAHYGLTGKHYPLNEYPNSLFEKHAIRWISAGSSAASPTWRSYVGRELLGLSEGF